MLTAKQNFLETIKPGGHPDRLVKQYEAIAIIYKDYPIYKHRNNPAPGEVNKKNNWGVTISWEKGQPGAFPVHKPDTIVCPDVEEWQDTVHAPDVTKYSEAEWEECQAVFDKIDRNEQFVAPFFAPGIFEMCHYLMEIKNCLMAFYESPDEMHELIKYITEWELKCAEVTCDHIHPDALFHHDDWGSQTSTFMSPDMFAEFYLEPYKEVYGYWKERGVQLIFHHSDSYAETLVPYMREMGIDVWQGAMRTNDLRKILDENPGFAIMGGVDSALVDYEGWDEETVKKVTRETVDLYGGRGFIPCQSQGLPFSTFPGVYEAIDKEIDAYSDEWMAAHKDAWDK